MTEVDGEKTFHQNKICNHLIIDTIKSWWLQLHRMSEMCEYLCALF